MAFRIIDINEQNLDQYGLFCKKSQKKEDGYKNKVTWIKEQFKSGLKYKLLLVNEKGKQTSRGFIEYTPSEMSWRGIEAEEWMVIHCLWVIGKHKNKGYGSKLLNLSIRDAKEQGMKGVVGMAAKKGGWLPNAMIYIKNGFKKVDECESDIELYALPFSEGVNDPRFSKISEKRTAEYREGINIFYTNQCPYLYGLIDDIEKIVKEKNKKFRKFLLKNPYEARELSLHPYGTFSIICEGKVIPYKPGIKSEITETLNNIK
jgi:GNAT superfamily N-acetyltransferase